MEKCIGYMITEGGQFQRCESEVVEGSEWCEPCGIEVDVEAGSNLYKDEYGIRPPSREIALAYLKEQNLNG